MPRGIRKTMNYHYFRGTDLPVHSPCLASSCLRNIRQCLSLELHAIVRAGVRCSRDPYHRAPLQHCGCDDTPCLRRTPKTTKPGKPFGLPGFREIWNP